MSVLSTMLKGAGENYLSGYPTNWLETIFNPKKAEYKINSALMAREMAFNSEQAQLQRDFEERMSNTAYQRAVADMRASGLNPYLAYSNGGASVPTGSSASIGAKTLTVSSALPSLLNSSARVVSSVLNAKYRTKNYDRQLANSVADFGKVVNTAMALLKKLG